MGTNNTLHHGK